ncbi:Na(+)/H(+) antiporter subunit C [Streptomyces thinghirensis]|nr:Na(+)/H(+) antiporter subunit C [Streptomyces thinghirensis]
MAAAVLSAVGASLLLTRSSTRILLGAVVLGNGVNLLVLASTGRRGRAAAPPLTSIRNRVTDPLPQAIAPTAIVITLATTAFLLAMAYRSHQVTGSDEISDDTEDRLVARRAREFLDRRGELRDRYREARAEPGTDPELGARYRAARKRLRRRSARNAPTRPAPTTSPATCGTTSSAPTPRTTARAGAGAPPTRRPAGAGTGPSVAGPSNDPEETGREPDSHPGEDLRPPAARPARRPRGRRHGRNQVNALVPLAPFCCRCASRA